MKVNAYINSTHTNTWGVVFGDTSLTALMTLPPKKSYITNKSSLIHGKLVLSKSTNAPKYDERDVSLVFYLRANSLPQFLTRYHAFAQQFDGGEFTLKLEVTEGLTTWTEQYTLLFVSCTQFSQFNGRLGKFTLKVNEPDPTNRTYSVVTETPESSNSNSDPSTPVETPTPSGEESPNTEND
jgi:hypothetical protein